MRRGERELHLRGALEVRQLVLHGDVDGDLGVGPLRPAEGADLDAGADRRVLLGQVGGHVAEEDLGLADIALLRRGGSK